MQAKVGKTLNSFLTLLIFFLLSVSVFSNAYSSDQGILSKSSTLPEAVATLGGRASVDDTDGFIDVLDPIWGSEEAFLFINPRASLSGNSANEENIGLGARKLIMEDCAIVGGNLFYDNRESEYGNRFHQLGLGAELLTEWVDFRANYYLPEKDKDLISSQEWVEASTDIDTSVSTFFTGNEVRERTTIETTTVETIHHLDKFESAMEGIDFEVGLKLPILTQVLETRAYGGYYFYDARYGDELKGFKARLEVRAAPGLIMDAEWYEDKELHGSDWYVGARVRLPFDIGNIFQRKNPFEGAREYFKPSTKPLKARMTDMVMRDIDIIREESEFIEDPAKLKIEKEVIRKSFDVTLLDGITFVDGDRGQGNGKTVLPSEGAGTFEDPYTTIQDAVDALPGGGIVYVDSAATPYRENVRLNEKITLWGSGLKVYGPESGEFPMIDGGSQGPSVTMARNSVVKGFRIRNTDQGGSEQLREVAGETFDISRVGIYAENKTDFTIYYNVVEENEVGILLASGTEVSNFETLVSDNTIQNNDAEGLRILGEGSAGEFHAIVQYNDVLSNGGTGIEIVASQYGKFDAEIVGNWLEQNGSDQSSGLVLTQDTVLGGTAQLNLTDNFAWKNGFHGFEIDMEFWDAGEKGIKISENQVVENGGGGIVANILGLGLTTENLTITGNEIYLNLGVGISLDVESGGSLVANINENYVTENDGGGIEANLVVASGDLTAILSSNTVWYNEGAGIVLEGDASSGKGLMYFQSNSVGQNAGDGIALDLSTQGALEAFFISNDVYYNGFNDAPEYEGDDPGDGGDGITVEATSSGESVYLEFSDNALVGSYGKDDLGKGLRVEATSKTDLSIYGAGNGVALNDSDGISILASSEGGTYKIDFGGGALGSPGNNSFTDNSFDNTDDFDFENANPDRYSISAQFNWWGGGIPNTSPAVDSNNELDQDLSLSL